MVDGKKTFSQDEVNAILARAIELQQHQGDGLTGDELRAAAAEAGISPEALEEATREVTLGRAHHAEEAAIVAEKRAGFRKHLTSYVCVGASLALLALVVGEPAVFFPAMLGWGIGLLSHGLAVLFANPARERERRAQERARREAKEAKRAERRRAAERRKRVSSELKARAEEFGTAVERGVATLFEVATEQIHEHVDAARRERGRPPRPAAAPVVTPPPQGRPPDRVRVDAETRRRVDAPPIVDAEWEDEPSSRGAGRRGSR